MDTDEFIETKSFASAAAETLTHLNIKTYIIFFIVFMLTSSDIFIKKILSLFSGAVDVRGSLTNKGILLQATIIVIVLILVDIFNYFEVL